jgi:hypothetical protein
LNAGPITSISFHPDSESIKSINKEIFNDQQIPELLIGTQNSNMLLLSRPDVPLDRPSLSTMKRGPANMMGSTPTVTSIVQGQFGKIRTLVAHPTNKSFAIGGENGT